MTTRRPISAHGLAVIPPEGWEATIYRRPAGPGEATFPVLHASTVSLPAGRGDYGGGLVERLGAGDVFVALLEFGPQAAGSALFPPVPAVPALRADWYRPKQLQRVIRGQGGVQRFFTFRGRAFCLYSVVGSVGNRAALVGPANQLVSSLEVGAA